MSIHFKFKSAKEYDTVSFPGTAIRLIDLKKAIVDKKKLTKGLDFDLVIADAQTGAEYQDDNQQLPKNSSVTVKRIPCRNNMGLLERLKQEAAAAAAANAPSLTVPTVSTAGPAHDLVANAAATSPKENEQLTMEDEMAALQSISKQAEDMRGTRGGNRTWTAGGGSNRITTRGPAGAAPRGVPVGVRAPVVVNNATPAPAPPRGFTNRPAAQTTGEAPPENYVCFRCGTPGHYIQHCPTNGDATYDTVRVKKKTGIPKTFMKAVGDRSEIKEGSGLTVVNAPWGGLAVVQAQSKHFSKFVEKSGGAAALDKFRLNPPNHLACKMCSRLMQDAVLIPCCQESACDECLRNALIGKHMHCPLCKTNNVSPERLLPNKVVRASVDEFLKSAQSEQKDRAKLVRETEEKMLAKQRDDAAAVEAANEKTSADAILDLKSAEEDEFGGDIFETTAKSQDKEEKTPQASPAPSNDSKAEPSEDTKPESNDAEKSEGNEKPQGEMPPNQWDPRGQGPGGAPWYNGPQGGHPGWAPPPWYNGPPARGLPPRPNYYGGPPPGYYGQGPPGWHRGGPPPRGNGDRYDDRRRGERRERSRSGDRRHRGDRRRSASPPDRRGRGDRERTEKDEGVRKSDKRERKDESRKEKRSSSKRRSPSRERRDSKRDSSRRRSPERDSKQKDDKPRRDKSSRSSSHRRSSPSPTRNSKREPSRRRSPERDLKRKSSRRSPSPQREKKRRSPERDIKRKNGRQVTRHRSRSAERDTKRTKRETKEDKKSWAERPVLETPRYAQKKQLEKMKKSTPTNYKDLSAPAIPLSCLTGEPSPR